jgi:hypothetical protein
MKDRASPYFNPDLTSLGKEVISMACISSQHPTAPTAAHGGQIEVGIILGSGPAAPPPHQGGQFQESVDEEAEPQVNQDTNVHLIELMARGGRKMPVEREVDPIA